MKKMGYKEYMRLRLKYSLWYLGFYGTALWYCGTILAQQEFDVFNVYKFLINSNTKISGNFILGHVMLISFLIHSVIWEAVAKSDFLKAASYLLLASFVILSYLIR